MRGLFFFLVLIGVLGGCQNGQFGQTGQGAVAGTALGAGLGAIIGHEVGSTGAGVAIGSAAGLLAGGLLGNEFEQTDQELSKRDARLQQQQQQLEENRKLIEQLRSRGADVRSTDRGVVVNLPDVLFDFDKARLTNSARATVRQIAEVIKETPGRDIYVEGHTDSSGTIVYNQRLSEDRAWSVADELAASGVERGRLFTKGYGEGDPIATNNTESGRARNRRVEVIIANR